jgi:anti-anti-sigma regulatory factor
MEPLVVDVTGLPAGSAGTIGALARLRLAARRTGHTVRLRGATAELRELLELAGLAGEFEWEAEERE